MKQKTMKQCRCHFLAVIVSLIFYVVLLPGAVLAGPAFSGITANADSAQTVVNNPAGMTRIKQPSVYGNPMVFYARSESEGTVKNTGYKQSSGDELFGAAPGLYYARPLGERWAVGIGPNSAMGLGASFDDDWAGRYLIQEWSLAFAGIAPSVAYRINNQISIGASLPIMYSRYTLEKAVFNITPGSADGSFELEADGWGMGVNVGLLYELTEHTRFGLIYRSKVSVTEEGKPEFSNLTTERAQLLNKFGVLNQDISVDTSTPQTVIAGMFHEFGNGWSFSLDVAWVDFSEWGLEEVTIGDSAITTRPGNYNDIWAATVGVNYALTPQWKVSSGVFYVSPPMDEENRTASMRLDEMWGVGLGFEYGYRKDRSVSFDVTYIQFGKGKFTAHDVPAVGDIQGEYTTNYGLVFSLGTKW
jgi:long-chain fatty acid transport protein